MDSQNKKHSPLRLLSSFHKNEDGTAMTEFVVVLPIFILMFVGMNELYKTNRQGLRAKITAAKSTWQASMDVANASQSAPSSTSSTSSPRRRSSIAPQAVASPTPTA